MSKLNTSHRMIRVARALGSVALLSTLAAPAFAAGGSASAPPPAPPEDPKVTATRYYNSGIRARNKAWKLEEKGGGDEKDAKKLAKAWENAQGHYERAVQLDSTMHQAWSDLGYVLRRQGEYPPAIEAYGNALSLAPDYAQAIEYVGVAFLHLGRLADAKASYMKLFELDRPLADQLLAEMKTWLEAPAVHEGEVDATAVEALATWVAEREQIALHVPALHEQQARLWR